MTERTLWRLEGATDETLLQPLWLERGLQLHLQHTELTSVLMQIGEQQQAYVGLDGCDSCAHGRCKPGCYVELLRRLLRVCFTGGKLHSVPGGLARRLYGRVALAWPTAKIAPLTNLSLAPWSEARLMMQWRGTYEQTACAALLAVGADGPNPAAALQVQGWQAWALPKALGTRLANNARPPRLPFARSWPHAPTLLWPQPSALGLSEGNQELARNTNETEPSASYADALHV
jgi:hypothetical protein